MFKEITGVLYDDPPISDEDKKLIENLDGKSKQIWDSLVSHSNRHFMMLIDDEWPAKLISENNVLYNWLNDWNNNHIHRFRDKLHTLPFSDNEFIYIFWMREIGIQTTWKTFCNNWINFLYEDEGFILVSQYSPNSLILSNGKSWYGLR